MCEFSPSSSAKPSNFNARFSSSTDNLEEQFENHEQIEISRYYEKLPKPTLIATQEFLDGNVYYRDPSKDNANTNAE